MADPTAPPPPLIRLKSPMTQLTTSAPPALSGKRQRTAYLSALQLLDLVFEQGRRDGRPVRLALEERGGELLRLLVAHLAGQRRLVGVDRHVDQRRTRVGERLAQRAGQ